MSREIEFRGFWKDIKGNFHNATGNLSIVNNELHKGCFISNEYGSPFAYEVIPETVGQYTGLKDCNGVKIFEGDILREYSNDIEDWVVSYEYGKFVGTYDNVCEDLYELSDLEVIGNIYESKGE